jgi:hypothetical protein
MTDGLGTAGKDLQRPLDESVPVDALTIAAAATEPAADPIDETATEPAAETATEAAAETATEAAAEAAADPADDTVSLRSAVPEDASAAPPPAEPREINLDTPLARVVRHVRRWLPMRAIQAAGRLPVRAGRGLLAWSRRPAGRFVIPGALTAALIAVAISTGAFLIPTAGVTEPEQPPASAGAATGVPNPTAPPGVVAPPVFNPTAAPAVGGNPTEALAGWAEGISTRTGVPVIALRAYGYAELVLATTIPGCQLRWTTLAAIGQVESGHGSSGGATLLPDGRALPAITGAPLDGQGNRRLISDTDGGQLDGDAVYDRAVGPMQFIPQTWYVQADPLRGIADVHNVNDASLAAAYYLCGNGRDLSTAEDWWSAILSYNNVQSYASAVFAYANQFGQTSQSG